ncbi:NAD(P)H-binding protein [Paenibacillus sp. N3/727]|uniref:NAD(P)-dependent oxidoreductase n=1 Tax=Paenibacillus sp. N3/727 TaxID=2925845 RepID=UPI001F531F69|nr:NAD(P)H-binding protein [Paenibacillus sp. N3/727]UNK18662.1 NAD(P)H-binding protein [Paenibacillus sp. N3/727]
MDNTKTIAIIGGTGKVGRHVAMKAVQSGYRVVMLARNPDKFKINDPGIEIIQGDAQSTDSIRLLLKDCEAVINTLGQPVKEQPIYSSVTNNILTIMSEYGVNRYIGVTGGSLHVPGDSKRLINKIGEKLFELFFSKMMIDKKKELNLLLNSDRDWTLIRLPFVVDGPETGDIKGKLTDMPGTKMTNGDIAAFLIDQVLDTQYIRKAPCISN